MSWIKDTLTDERGRPSANRQAGFAALIAAIVFACIGSPDYVVYGFVGLAGGIFTGTQMSKFTRGSNNQNEAI